MDRVAQLAEEAEQHLAVERLVISYAGFAADAARAATRKALAAYAVKLGFTDKEISAAIDTALKGR